MNDSSRSAGSDSSFGVPVAYHGLITQCGFPIKIGSGTHSSCACWLTAKMVALFFIIFGLLQNIPAHGLQRNLTIILG